MLILSLNILNPETQIMNDTPETDAELAELGFGYYTMGGLPTDAVKVEFARKLERERNEAYAALISLRKGYGGQLADYADDECKCTDCEVLRKIDAVLKKHEL